MGMVEKEGRTDGLHVYTFFKSATFVIVEDEGMEREKGYRYNIVFKFGHCSGPEIMRTLPSQSGSRLGFGNVMKGMTDEYEFYTMTFNVFSLYIEQFYVTIEGDTDKTLRRRSGKRYIIFVFVYHEFEIMRIRTFSRVGMFGQQKQSSVWQHCNSSKRVMSPDDRPTFFVYKHILKIFYRGWLGNPNLKQRTVNG